MYKLSNHHVFILENCNCKNILHLWKRDLGVESLARNVMTGSKARPVPSGPRASSLSSYPSERARLSAPLLQVAHFCTFCTRGRDSLLPGRKCIWRLRNFSRHHPPITQRSGGLPRSCINGIIEKYCLFILKHCEPHKIKRTWFKSLLSNLLHCIKKICKNLGFKPSTQPRAIIFRSQGKNQGQERNGGGRKWE